MSQYVLSAEARTVIQDAINLVQGDLDREGKGHSREAAHLEAVKEQFALVCSERATEEDARRLSYLMWTRAEELREETEEIRRETQELRRETQILEGMIALHQLGEEEDDFVTVN